MDQSLSGDTTRQQQSDANFSRSSQAMAARLLAAHAIALAVGLCIVAVGEMSSWNERVLGELGWTGWLVDMNVDSSPFALLFLLAPLCWMVRRPLLSGRNLFSRIYNWMIDIESPKADRTKSHLRPWILSLLIAATSLTVSVGIAKKFGELPPAYHDEYSYLFQAKTFLAGRLSYPSHPTAPGLFDQMHVLNEGRFASRYFPGTGAWIAPFLSLGHPYWGHWLAGAMTASLIFWVGRELGGDGLGFIAGMLVAVSPGLGLFSNLLLAHHPTLVGLSLFLFAFLRMMRTRHWVWAALAGIGLSFAMLCRPMTAAGFGLPFGIWLFWWLWRGEKTQPADNFRFRLRLTVALGTPVVVGMMILFAYNRAITGSGWTTPYQVFTDIYTPRHGYGFKNVIRGEQHLGPKVLDHYDKWALNLTPQLAAENVFKRLLASGKWSLGIIPLAMALPVFLLGVVRTDRRWWLIFAAIVSLHAAHIPYWYVGIMNWHYIFESGPLWLLIFAGTSVALLQFWRRVNRPWMPIWWFGLVAAALLPTFASPGLFWPQSRIDEAVSEISFSRQRYAEFQEMIDLRVTRRPALVLIEPDEADRHIDFVVNDPDLNADVLFGRARRTGMSLEEIVGLFPERTCYLFRVKQGTLARIRFRARK